MRFHCCGFRLSTRPLSIPTAHLPSPDRPSERVDQQEDASHHAQTYVLEGGLFMVFVQRVVVIFDRCCSLSVLTGR